MMQPGGWLRDWLPPVALRLARRASGRALRFEQGFDSWADALAASRGYAAGEILARVRSSTLSVLRGEAAACRDGAVLPAAELAWPVLAGLLGAAARDGGRLRVLDVGGALGGSFLQYRAWLAGLRELRWTVIEQPGFVECGRREIHCEGLDFATCIDDALAGGRPNVVLLGGVLQYLEDPHAMLRDAARAGTGRLILDRTPISGAERDILLVQHAPRRLSHESYPAWVLSRQRLLAPLAGAWSVREWFDCPEGEFRLRGGVRFRYRGLIMDRVP